MYESQKKYKAIAIANKLATSKDKGTPSVQIKFQTEFDITSGEFVKKTFFADLWLSDGAFDRSMDTLTGVFGFNSSNIQDINDDPYLFAGVEAVIVTETEDYQGEQREKVKFINHPNGTVKKLNDLEAARLNNLLLNKINAYHAKNPKSVAVPVVKTGTVAPMNASLAIDKNNDATPHGDCDLPF